MRVVVTTMIYKREQLFAIWASCVNRLKENFPEVEIIGVVVGSEGIKSKNLVEAHGFKYAEVPNSPLGRKANKRLEVCKKLKPDYVLFVGSDDLVSKSAFAYMLKYMFKGLDEICQLDLYYYDVPSKISVYSMGYINHRSGEPMGPGRCVSKKLLDKLNWRIWRDHIERGLDSCSRDKLASIEHTKHIYRLSDTGGMIVDIKNGDGLTRFAMRENYKKIPFLEIAEQFPEADRIKML